GDVPPAPRAIVISEAMGRVLWPQQDPIGKCIRFGIDTAPCGYVVGIAENIKDQTVGADSTYYYYLSALQARPQSGWLLARARADAAAREDGLCRQLHAAMPGASCVAVAQWSDMVGGHTRSGHRGAMMFAAFGLLALVLAAIGVFGVISYNVAQRIPEMGVRL